MWELLHCFSIYFSYPGPFRFFQNFSTKKPVPCTGLRAQRTSHAQRTLSTNTHLKYLPIQICIQSNMLKVSKYDEECKRIENAVQLLRKHANPNILQYATDYDILYRRLLRAYHGGHDRKTRPPTNRLLNPT
ncbi:hypothetical protein BCR34DRAFT_226126 [Clohesyomyces aquaticus]|uniref:Uncharacterized protein n=1 Tax=Clohesyomyces aquaticus TaxID=1231657 RepID=A0A1Y1Y8F9_9PLEO|nr:hypothetical protein BCR34DRAFT_226126 [Clohesyomyces aquaticus]